LKYAAIINDHSVLAGVFCLSICPVPSCQS